MKDKKGNVIEEALCGKQARYVLASWSDVVWRSYAFSINSDMNCPPRLVLSFNPAPHGDKSYDRIKKLLDLANGLFNQEHAPCEHPDAPKVAKLVDSMLAAVESVLLKSLEERDAAKDGCDNDT